MKKVLDKLRLTREDHDIEWFDFALRELSKRGLSAEYDEEDLLMSIVEVSDHPFVDSQDYEDELTQKIRSQWESVSFAYVRECAQKLGMGI